MPKLRFQAGEGGSQTVVQAFTNVQNLIRKCKNPALDADDRDVLQESLQTLANRLNKADEMEKSLKDDSEET